MTDAAALDATPPDDSAVSGAGASERVLPAIENAIGPLRQAILDHLLDMVDAGPQSVAQILAALPAGTTRGNAEAAIHREFRAGRIRRVSPGHYVLAPPKPPAPPAPPPAAAVALLAAIASFAPPIDLAGMTESEWFAALEAWHADPSTWDVAKLGPPPDQAGHRVPPPILAVFRDRVRAREKRAREAEAAAARRAAADRELRDQLIAACHGNLIRGPALDDVAPIRAALETVPLDVVLAAIRGKTDRKIFPGNQPAVSWREERLLRAIAEKFCRYKLAPAMAASWAAGGNAPGKSAEACDASAGVPACPPAREILRPQRGSPAPVVEMPTPTTTVLLIPDEDVPPF